MKAKQEEQDELEEAAMRKALGLESSETQEDTSSTTSTEEQDELEEAAVRKSLALELPESQEDASSNASTEEPFSDAACAEEHLPHAEEEEGEERALLPLAEELSHVEECEALQLLEDFLGERSPFLGDLFAKPSGSRTKKKSRARRERPSLLCLGARLGKNKK